MAEDQSRKLKKKKKKRTFFRIIIKGKSAMMMMMVSGFTTTAIFQFDLQKMKRKKYKKKMSKFEPTETNRKKMEEKRRNQMIWWLECCVIAGGKALSPGCYHRPAASSNAPQLNQLLFFSLSCNRVQFISILSLAAISGFHDPISMKGPFTHASNSFQIKFNNFKFQSNVISSSMLDQFST